MNRESTLAVNDVIDVKVFSFSGLLYLAYPLALDNTQRAYVWGREKTEQLVRDPHEYEQQACRSNGVTRWLYSIKKKCPDILIAIFDRYYSSVNNDVETQLKVAK